MSIGAFLQRVQEQVSRSRWWADDDLKSIFWLGVVEAMDDLTEERTQMAYIMARGRGAVRNAQRSHWSRVMTKRCVRCGREAGFRTDRCPRCGGELRVLSRIEPYRESISGEVEDISRVDVELFIATLSGRLRYVAQRWLRDRADLHHDNHLQRIAEEIGISAPAVARMKRIIRERFRAWWAG